MNLEQTYTEAQLKVLNSIQEDTKYLIVTKGRRFGATQSIAHLFNECMIEGQRLLWGDTIHPNIDRYVDRYFLPPLKAAKINYNYNAQKKELKLLDYGGYVDFRSADKPENWEGFGYHKIFLNEAGIILKNDYLYTNAVLPMLLDYEDSILIAAGVPKGKTRKDGKPHRFYSLYQSALNGEKGFLGFNFSSYDNPLLKEEDIKELEKEIGRMNPEMVQQEIYGKFVDGAGGLLWDVAILHRQRIETKPDLKRICIAIDPATTANKDSDETGITVCGIDYNNNGYLLEDLSGTYSPSEWGNIAFKALRKWDADYYVAEKNQGGDMVSNVIRQHDKTNRVKLVQATKGKFTRAEPIYSLYEQGKVYHVGNFPKLENQMISFNPDSSVGSPDRVDALVWGFTDLMIKKRELIVV